MNNFKSAIRIYGPAFEMIALKWVEKRYHDFFAYRCADYQNLNHLLKCHQISLIVSQKTIDLINEYWSCIDVIHFKIKGLPKFELKRSYFEMIEKIELNSKIADDVEFFEVKYSFKPNKKTISVRTAQFAKKLKKINRELKLIEINGGYLKYPEIKLKPLDPSKFYIETHYGKKNYYLKLETQE